MSADVLCRLADLDATGAKEVVLEKDGGRFPIFVIRSAGHIVGYVALGSVIRSHAEATTPDGNRWRLVEFTSKPGWILRSDFIDVSKRGDRLLEAAPTELPLSPDFRCSH